MKSRIVLLVALLVVSWPGAAGQRVQACYDGQSLAIASATVDDAEVCYWFKSCMANELFTFFRVGYREVNRSYPSVDGILLSTGITWLNSTSSDNIGPLNMSNGGWVGGNHHRYGMKTAVTDAVEILVDGVTLAPDDVAVDGRVVTVTVVNTVFDPVGDVDEDETSFVDPMLTETVVYTVTGNSIDVVVKHDYVGGLGNTVVTYYGMQSMFNGEDRIMTVHGAYPDFVDSNDAVVFNVSTYPDFDCFIEKKTSTGWCQSALLLPDGLGDHHLMKSKQVFVHGSGKCYHVLIRNLPVTSGLTYHWHGIYSWFVPIVDDDDLLVYTMMADGEEQLVIDAKRDCSTDFELPQRIAGKMLVPVVKDAGMRVSQNHDRIMVRADGPGSCRARFAEVTTSVTPVRDHAVVRPIPGGVEIQARCTRVMVCDLSGRVMRQEGIDGVACLPLPPGCYIVAVDGRAPVKVMVR